MVLYVDQTDSLSVESHMIIYVLNVNFAKSHTSDRGSSRLSRSTSTIGCSWIYVILLKDLYNTVA